jgi:hypothetical protein
LRQVPPDNRKAMPDSRQAGQVHRTGGGRAAWWVCRTAQFARYAGRRRFRGI